MTARVARDYSRSDDTSAESEGSVQTRGNGNVFVGFGSEPDFSEFSKKGKLLYDARQPEDNGSYRVYRHHWSASPKTEPTFVARRDGGTTSIFVSWNGDTETRTWQVLGGSDSQPMSPVATAKRKGFETRIDLTTSAEKLKLRALDAEGRKLSTSKGQNAP